MELCNECLGEGIVVQQSQAISTKQRQRKCNTCKGTGSVPSIMNDAFLSNNIFIEY